MAKNHDAVAAAVEAAKSSPIANGADALGRLLAPPEDLKARVEELEMALRMALPLLASQDWANRSNNPFLVAHRVLGNCCITCGHEVTHGRCLNCTECECGNPECDRPHYCDECGDELPMGEMGICRPCYREDPMNNPRVDEDRS